MSKCLSCGRPRGMPQRLIRMRGRIVSWRYTLGIQQSSIYTLEKMT